MTVNPLYVVIDTNVLVSAMLNHNSIPGKILKHAILGTFTSVLTKEILDEYIEVLSRPKFGFPSHLISSVVAGLVNKGRFLNPASVDLDMPDPKDVVFYQLTIESLKICETYLVTGNSKHFPTEDCVVTPRQLIEI